MTGRLTLIGHSSRRHLDFLEGEIVYASSTVPSERLGSWLAYEGLLPVDQLRRLLAVSLLRRTLFTGLLVDRGGFSADHLRTSLTRLAETITSRVMADNDVRFVLDPDYPVRQLLGLTLHVEPNSLILEAARRNDENGRDLAPDEAFPTEFCGEAFETLFWDLIREGISDEDRVDGEEMVRLQQLIRDILGVLADWLSSSPGLVPVPDRQAAAVSKQLDIMRDVDLDGLPHAAWNQMVLACAIRGPDLRPPQSLAEVAASAAELNLWNEMFSAARWRRPETPRIDDLVEDSSAAWSAAASAAADYIGVPGDTVRLAVNLVTVPTDLVLWVLSSLPVSHRRLKYTLVRELPRRLGRSLAHMADFPPLFRTLFESSDVTPLGACLHLARGVLPTAHVWPTTVPEDEALLAAMIPPGALSDASKAAQRAPINPRRRAAAS
jgi:hypothetical protein